MTGHTQNPIEQAVNALSSTLDDVKAGAKAGAVKGAAAGALSVLGAKAAGTAQDAATSNGDLGKKARKAQKNAGKMLSQASDKAGKKATAAGLKAGAGIGKKVAETTVESKASGAAQMLQMLGKRASDTAQQATDGGINLNIDPNDVPRLLRGLTLVATGLGTIFAPGSKLDVSKHVDVDIDASELATQAREGIDTAADLTQQRIRDLVDVVKESLSSLSDAMTTGIETAENRAQEALDETESRLTDATHQAADTAKSAVPEGKKQGGGTLRWLIFGMLLGGIVAFISSPLSGPVGERVMNLRRDLGFGGDEGDDNQYWPSPPQSTSTTDGNSASSPQASAGGESASTETGKAEPWNETPNVKEKPNKA